MYNYPLWRVSPRAIKHKINMGGKLFGLGRIPYAQYLTIENDLRAYLDQKLPNAYQIPRYYGNKADFGDLDIIISAERAGKGISSA